MSFMQVRFIFLNETFIFKDHNVEKHRSYLYVNFLFSTDKAHNNTYVCLT